MFRRTTGFATLALTSLAIASLALAGCTAQSPPPAVVANAPHDVGVELFELPWNSVAAECETTVGPNGFAWVLTSPAQQHAAGDQWWTSYHPDGYAMDSRLGTRAEFAAMVTRCAAVGVKVIATAVVVDAAPVAQKPAPTQTPTTAPTATPTQTPTAAPTAAPAPFMAYLADLLSLGVAGFRIDGAAAPVASAQVQAIADRLPQGTIVMSDLNGTASAPAPVAETYAGTSRIFTYQYGQDLGAQLSIGAVRDPALVDPRPGHVPAASAVVFIDDHTSERADAPLTYRDGPLYVLANVLMLADDYGTPMVSSGYAFTSRDAGPPASADGQALPASCKGVTAPRSGLTPGERTCPQAWTAIAGMLAWRSAVGDAPRLAASKGGDLYGFERSGRGVVAVNPGGSEGWVIVPTSMPDGEYCDVITGGADAAAGGVCAGNVYKVENGSVTFHLPALSAAAIHLGSRRA